MSESDTSPEPHEPLEGSYFVSTYPPFSCWNAEGAATYRATLDRAPGDPAPPLGLYVHVPFCAERCQYCYYLSYERRGGEVPGYVDALVAEAGRYARRTAIAGRPLDFVYFGGGTPSILSARQTRQLLSGLRAALPWDAPREVTFECAPRSVTAEKLHLLRDHGVTRLSLGVQQLDDAVLAANGRIHLVADVERAWVTIREAGFDVVNLDLMVGLVGETERGFFDGLERVIAMHAESVTIYQLEVPLNTPLYRALRDGGLDAEPASWSEKRARLVRAYARLEEAGYTWRSAYTAVRDPERHRFVYQDELYRGADLIGLGASAFGQVSGASHQNRAGLDAYLAAIAGGDLPLWRGYRLSAEERLVRELVLQMKLGRVDTVALGRRFGVDVAERFAAPFSRFASAGFVELRDGCIVVMPGGLARVDRLVTELYLPLHRGVRYS